MDAATERVFAQYLKIKLKRSFVINNNNMRDLARLSDKYTIPSLHEDVRVCALRLLQLNL